MLITLRAERVNIAKSGVVLYIPPLDSFMDKKFLLAPNGAI